MRIASVKVENYKSFLSSAEIHFTPGFNVIVGQNNAGKTALVEALSLQFENKPHRSLKTVPTRSTTLSSSSEVNVSFNLEWDELMELLITNNESEFHIPVPKAGIPHELAGQFLKMSSVSIQCLVQPGRLAEAGLTGFGELGQPRRELRFRVDRLNRQLEYVDGGGSSVNSLMGIADILKRRIYIFTAERLNIGESEIFPATILESNAANLPTVLNHLQTSNTSRFERFNQLVRTIFPDIKQITVPPISNNRARILIWSIDPSSERDDLAVQLSESGTGIGQVLSMLYVVLTADFPRMIIIDEPQSFLHPGAVRKLFDIFQKKEHSHHQYIITTHSPAALTAANPHTLIMVRKKEAESSIKAIDMNETQQLNLVLSEVGARLSDVFGADDILWVEGRTEEICFPLILASEVTPSDWTRC